MNRPSRSRSFPGDAGADTVDIDLVVADVDRRLAALPPEARRSRDGLLRERLRSEVERKRHALSCPAPRPPGATAGR